MLHKAAGSEKILIQLLAPGAVIRTYAPFANKEKFLIIATIAPELLVLVINSTPTNFVLNNPKLFRCHVKVEREDHTFLHHDSWADCVEAHECFSLEEIRSSIVQNFQELYKGRVNDKCLAEIRAAVSFSEVMEIRHQKWILSALDAYLNKK